MSALETTLLETIEHLLNKHPSLINKLWHLINAKVNRNSFDVNFSYRLNESLLRNSKSQIRQDIFCLMHTGFKRNGYFVEFGAADGVKLSNTHLLEYGYGWNGVLAEPAKSWHEDLRKNRSCHIDTRCVYSVSGEKIEFNETKEATLSTIDKYSNVDEHSEVRKNGSKYNVTTVSLEGLLDYYDAPKHIDYLSIDTEGSEYEILSVFDFSKYSFSVITCEHNHTDMREKIYDLLTRKGYSRVMEDVSQFDDWYIRN